MGIFKQFFNNTRKPDGWMGKLMVNGMNQGHAAVSDWGLSYFPDIPVAAHSMVADFGCGGGRNTAALLKHGKLILTGAWVHRPVDQTGHNISVGQHIRGNFPQQEQ